MAETNRQRARRVFIEVADLSDDGRAAALDRACADDTELRAEVQALLDAQSRAGAFMATPTAEAARQPIGGRATAPEPQREGPGTHIGPYKLLQLIGEGGFGSVFMAEQERPVSRKVALKIIKLGMDTKAVIARFEAERQALALMDHPSIARVLDAGATETGRPYFVMELVKGEPIVEYCDKNNLSIAERLELFAQVCQAVQHAHTKGIIHRDVKPSNILVSTQDGKAHAKVIDFGIAKATASKLTERTLFTEHKALIGTPEYMSPEQAEGSLDIDTRTDVYSLGVLLYELLTGTTPFSAKDLRSAAYAEIQRIIREVEPPKPSTRLSSNTDTLDSVAAHRHTEPRRLGTIVRGELDWIVMKAMEKDRQRRYETANGLAMDVQRYIAGEPVLAAPPGSLYRMQKFVRRNRVAVLTAGLVVLVLLGAGVSTAISLQRTRVLLAELRQEKSFRTEVERLNDLIGLSHWQGGMEEAIQPALDAADGFERLVGPADRRTLSARALHANKMFRAGRHAEAGRAYERCIEQRITHLGTNDEWTIGLLDEYSGVLEMMGSDRWREFVRRAAEAARDHLKPGNGTRDRVMWRMANLLKNSGDARAASAWYALLVESIKARDHPAPEELHAAEEHLRECQQSADTR